MSGRHRTSATAEISRLVLLAMPAAFLFLAVVAVATNMLTVTTAGTPAVMAPQPPSLTADEGALPTSPHAAPTSNTAPPTTPAPDSVAPAVAIVTFTLGPNQTCHIQGAQLAPSVRVAACFVDSGRMFVVVSNPIDMPAVRLRAAVRLIGARSA